MEEQGRNTNTEDSDSGLLPSQDATSRSGQGRSAPFDLPIPEFDSADEDTAVMAKAGANAKRHRENRNSKRMSSYDESYPGTPTTPVSPPASRSSTLEVISVTNAAMVDSGIAVSSDAAATPSDESRDEDDDDDDSKDKAVMSESSGDFNEEASFVGEENYSDNLADTVSMPGSVGDYCVDTFSGEASTERQDDTAFSDDVFVPEHSYTMTGSEDTDTSLDTLTDNANTSLHSQPNNGLEKDLPSSDTQTEFDEGDTQTQQASHGIAPPVSAAPSRASKPGSGRKLPETSVMEGIVPLVEPEGFDLTQDEDDMDTLEKGLDHVCAEKKLPGHTTADSPPDSDETCGESSDRLFQVPLQSESSGCLETFIGSTSDQLENQSQHFVNTPSLFHESATTESTPAEPSDTESLATKPLTTEATGTEPTAIESPSTELCANESLAIESSGTESTATESVGTEFMVTEATAEEVVLVCNENCFGASDNTNAVLKTDEKSAPPSQSATASEDHQKLSKPPVHVLTSNNLSRYGTFEQPALVPTKDVGAVAERASEKEYQCQNLGNTSAQSCASDLSLVSPPVHEDGGEYMPVTGDSSDLEESLIKVDLPLASEAVPIQVNLVETSEIGADADSAVAENDASDEEIPLESQFLEGIQLENTSSATKHMDSISFPSEEMPRGSEYDDATVRDGNLCRMTVEDADYQEEGCHSISTQEEMAAGMSGQELQPWGLSRGVSSGDDLAMSPGVEDPFDDSFR